MASDKPAINASLEIMLKNPEAYQVHKKSAGIIEAKLMDKISTRNKFLFTENAAGVKNLKPLFKVFS